MHASDLSPTHPLDIDLHLCIYVRTYVPLNYLAGSAVLCLHTSHPLPPSLCFSFVRLVWLVASRVGVSFVRFVFNCLCRQSMHTYIYWLVRAVCGGGTYIRTVGWLAAFLLCLSLLSSCARPTDRLTDRPTKQLDQPSLSPPCLSCTYVRIVLIECAYLMGWCPLCCVGGVRSTHLHQPRGRGSLVWWESPCGRLVVCLSVCL